MAGALDGLATSQHCSRAATASEVAGFGWPPATASQPRLAASGELSDYSSCFEGCSPSLDSGDFLGWPATVSVSGSPGFGACSSASSGRSCVDSLMAASSVADRRCYPTGAAATLVLRGNNHSGDRSMPPGTAKPRDYASPPSERWAAVTPAAAVSVSELMKKPAVAGLSGMGAAGLEPATSR